MAESKGPQGAELNRANQKSARVAMKSGPEEIGVTQTTSGGVHGTYVPYLKALQAVAEAANDFLLNGLDPEDGMLLGSKLDELDRVKP